MPDISRSGDGLLAGLQMLALLKDSKAPASQLFHAFTPSPQRLENITGLDPAILDAPAFQADLQSIQAGLADQGRVLVRASGTEALIRVMVEAETDALLTATMDAVIFRLQQGTS